MGTPGSSTRRSGGLIFVLHLVRVAAIRAPRWRDVALSDAPAARKGLRCRAVVTCLRSGALSGAHRARRGIGFATSTASAAGPSPHDYRPPWCDVVDSRMPEPGYPIGAFAPIHLRAGQRVLAHRNEFLRTAVTALAPVSNSEQSRGALGSASLCRSTRQGAASLPCLLFVCGRAFCGRDLVRCRISHRPSRSPAFPCTRILSLNHLFSSSRDSLWRFDQTSKRRDTPTRCLDFPSLTGGQI